ncbi:MAG: tryptophan halogenase family protein [Brevirhabdus sp.]
MGKPIQNITIVGGGTAGWLSALILSKTFAHPSDDRPPVQITLIESPNVATVGVGEATVPNMPRTLQYAGISEQQFFKECNASFKLGVMFSNWNVDRKGKFIEYMNPFEAGHPIDGAEPAEYFLRFGAGKYDFVQSVAAGIDFARACKGPRPLGAPEYRNSVSAAYHLDAGAFARMMQAFCTAQGVEHVRDDVVDVELDERGFVAALQLKEQGRRKVELVIDCTGFRGLIINKALKEPFESYSKYLANDKALAVQLPHKNPKKIESMTRSTALGAGWSWRVPLYHRVGTGYVFSSAHRTDDEAADEFLAHLGDQGKGAEPRVIPMRVGRSTRHWVKNVVAVGLSGGFIEPLESTAIHMIDMALRWLVTYFPDTDFSPALSNRYNEVSGAFYDEVRDFICLHYALNNRDDTQYWIDARTELEVPDSLAANLEIWRHKLPAAMDLPSAVLFSFHVYQAVLLGKQVYENGWGAEDIKYGQTLDRDLWRRLVAKTRGEVDRSLKLAPDHRTLLTHLRGDRPEPRKPGFAPASAGVSATVPMPGAAPAARVKVSLGEQKVQADDGPAIL